MTETGSTRHLAISSASGVVWIPSLLTVTSCAAPDKAKKVHACVQRGVESNETLLMSVFAENRHELPGLGPAFLQHLGAVSSIVVSKVLAELR